MRTKACVYGALLHEPQPVDGAWIIHEHRGTGELLGPSVVGGIPTRAVYARLTQDGWAKVEAREQ